MEFGEFQRSAARTEQSKTLGPDSLMIPILGLLGESGSLATVYKKYLRDGLSWQDNTAFIAEELGDALWYIACIANRCDLDLNEIASSNLARTSDRYGDSDRWQTVTSLPRLDADFLEGEQFPDKLVVRFEEQLRAGKRPQVSMYVVHAEPGLRPGVRSVRDSVYESIGTDEPLRVTLGDALTDNSSVPDEYRYHDAFHLGFLAFLGWSPVLRALLKLKRKSDPLVDESQDGARAIDVEEGLASMLRQRARSYNDFQKPEHVDSDTVKIILEHTIGLEVQTQPAWLWREAIAAGFSSWRLLSENRGGYLVCDLSKRSLTYLKTWSY